MASVAMNEAIERPSISPKSSMISGTSTIKQGGNRLMNRFFGNKSSATKELFFEESSIDYILKQAQPEAFPLGLIKPCPFIRPLEHRLEARSEPRGVMPIRPKKARSFDTISTCRSSAMHIAMKTEKGHRVLNNSQISSTTTLHKDEGVADLSSATSVIDLQIFGSRDIAKKNIEMQISQQAEYVAEAAAEDSQVADHWDYYIQCYSKGQFNLNHPPEPPARKLSFKYLPAVFPHQEETRMQASQSYDILWPNWSKGKVNALICAAMKEFDTCLASISFFDGKYEHFKVESGYNVSRISRPISIGAHALLSVDALVVLDTRLDWRFKGNPLVCNEPKIRFFAGAPMISPDGHAVGVFAIFSREPRTTFNAAQRRELAAYSAMALKDINQQTLWLSDIDLHSPRSTPLLDRDSIYRPKGAKSPTVDVDHTLVPSGLRYHKMKTPPIADAKRLFLNQQLSPSVLSEQTPPSSSEGSEKDTFPGSPRGFGKNHKQLSIRSDLKYISFDGNLTTPDSDAFQLPSPRPFSASDLTSLNPHPPNTPIIVSQDLSSRNYSDLTVENFLSLSDFDCAEPDSPPLIDLSSPEEQTRKSKRKKKQRRARVSSRLTTSSVSSMYTCRSRKSKDPRVQAALACAGFAQRLGFDLMYVLEIHPTKPSMTDQELFAPRAIQTNLLVVYGLEKRMEFSAELHIKVLRGRGYQSIADQDATVESGDFRIGYLIPIQTENDAPVRKRSSGLVFAAFKRPNPHEVGQPVQRQTVEQAAELKGAAMKLKRILLSESDSRGSPRKFKSESSSPKRYLANEAREVGKHLLDETSGGYFVDEAVEVGSHSPSSEEATLQTRYPAGEATEIGQFIQDNVADQYVPNEAVEVAKPSLDSISSRVEPAQPKRLTKSSKASSQRKSNKSDKNEAVELSFDAGLERPFHAVARFRPF